ncbi:MAG: hydroxymethylbilane synthase [Actinomycetota bacterium]|jgi:hydroxymethylbilane synthase
MTTLRIATRRSELAMAQAGIVRMLLTAQGFEVVLIPLSTSGDEDAPRAGGDGKDRWIDAILDALRSGAADLAVHSAKDLPAEDPDDLVIGAVPERAEAHDVLVAGDPAFLDGPGPRAGARVGTSSLRRIAQLRAAFPGVDIVELRGNVPTRLRKVTSEGAADVAVLAAAGLTRLGLAPATVVPLGIDVMVPAPGQGALAIQCRTDDRPLRATLSSMDHRASRATLVAERTLTRSLGGDCNLPLGAIAAMRGDTVRLAACVAMPDGSQVVRAAAESDNPERAAEIVATQLRRGGAEAILDAIRQP